MSIKKIIQSQKGETLIESIVSLFVFTLLITAVTAMIQVALGMTEALTRSAEDAQNEVNLAVLSNYTGGDEADITFEAAALGISAEHKVVLNASDELLAFAPKED